MALVIKSWSVKSSPAAGEPYVKVIARESGFWSFVFSLLGIDATTTMQVSSTRIEFEQGSLSGFIRRLTPFGHISSTFYGRHKPWKTALGFFGLCTAIGSAIGNGWAFLLFFLVGLIGGGLYYFLNRELMIGFNEDSGASAVITFKRSVIEGQEIDETQLQKIISVIENLIKSQGTDLGHVDMGGAPSSARAASAAPTTFKEIVQGPAAIAPAVKPAVTQPSTCPTCNNTITPDDVFCGGCGHKLK
jgi:hypothetical protein